MFDKIEVTCSTLVRLLRCATTAILVVVWMGVPTASAYAYVDPSVMTYTIQAVAGLAVALSAVLGVVFRRTRKKLYQVFGVDENANKVAEQSVERINPDEPEAPQQLQDARDKARAMKDACEASISSAARDLSGKKRFVFALVMCVFVAFIVFIAPSLEIFGSNTDSLVFGLGSVWWIPVVFCLALAIVFAGLLSLLKGKAFYTALVIVFAIGVAAYVQSLFLNQGMMPADGGYIGWDDWFFVQKKIVSGIVWIVILVALPILSRWHAHTWLKATTGLACAIMVVQLVGVISVGVDAAKAGATETGKPYVTQGGLLSVSERDNVVEFVLDTYDTAILDDVLKDDPQFLKDFEDFTYFHNSAGVMIPTTNAIPYMLTAQKPEPGQDIADYRRTKYAKSTFFDDICDLGYSIGMYTDSAMFDFSQESDLRAAGQTVNVHSVSSAPIDVGKTFVAMMQCALYREAPWVFKPVFWYYTSDINNRMIADGKDVDLNESLYELDDARILQMLRTDGLKTDDEGTTGAFRFIHLFGPHFPFSIDEEGAFIGTNQTDQTKQAKGSMQVVIEYMNQLKQLGLYDNATIIVTADHGVWNLTDDPVQRPISPIMLVKPKKDAGSARQAVQESNLPVSHDNHFAMVIAGMQGDSAKYGKTFFEETDPDRVRYFDALTNAGGNGQRFVEYAITGDVMNIANWEKTGQTWQDA